MRAPKAYMLLPNAFSFSTPQKTASSCEPITAAVAASAANSKRLHYFVCADETLAWERLSPEIGRILARCDHLALTDPEFRVYGYRFNLAGTAAARWFSLYRVTRRRKGPRPLSPPEPPAGNTDIANSRREGTN